MDCVTFFSRRQKTLPSKTFCLWHFLQNKILDMNAIIFTMTSCFSLEKTVFIRNTATLDFWGLEKFLNFALKNVKNVHQLLKRNSNRTRIKFSHFYFSAWYQDETTIETTLCLKNVKSIKTVYFYSCCFSGEN